MFQLASAAYIISINEGKYTLLNRKIQIKVSPLPSMQRRRPWKIVIVRQGERREAYSFDLGRFSGTVSFNSSAIGLGDYTVYLKSGRGISVRSRGMRNFSVVAYFLCGEYKSKATVIEEVGGLEKMLSGAREVINTFVNGPGKPGDNRRLEDNVENFVGNFLGLFIDKGQPSAWVTLAIGLGTFAYTESTSAEDEILESLDSIKTQIGSVEKTIEAGFARIEALVGARFIDHRLVGDQLILDSYQRKLGKYLKSTGGINNVDVANFKESCNTAYNQPIDLFVRFYQRGCSECLVYEGTKERMDDAIRYLDEAYTTKDSEIYRQTYGQGILNGLIESMLMYVMCIPDVEYPECPDPGDFSKESEKMKKAFLEVYDNLEKEALQLNDCWTKEIRLTQVSKMNIRSLDNGGPVELQFRVNDELYMPQSRIHCTKDICITDSTFQSNCIYNSRDKVCTVATGNYSSGEFRNSPKIERKLKYKSWEPLRFHVSEKDKGADDDFKLTTFEKDEIKEKESEVGQCQSYDLVRTEEVNGQSGSRIRIKVESKERAKIDV